MTEPVPINGDDIALIRACFSCGHDAAALLAAAMSARHCPHRSAIAHQGDVCSQLMLVVEGAVVAELFAIDGQQVQLARYGPGEVFGSYPHETTLRANITATGQTRLLTIATRRIAAMAQEHVEVANGVANLLAQQLDLLLDRMAARIGLSATGRFYRALMHMADSEGRISPAPVVAAVAVSVQTTRETASRALAAVVRRGIVERHDDGLTIVSRRMLEELIV